jgi:DHA1 family tetracycline resistance protein-like MFS transporter
MKRPLLIILLIAFVDLVGFGLIIPLQAVYADRLGANGVTFGTLVGAYALMQFIFNPLLGRWSDRMGRRPVLLISIAGSVVSHGLLGVADLAQSLPLLFIARILDGITGANIATAQAYIADVTEAQDRAKGMGFFGAAFGLGFVLGPAIGAALAFLGKAASGEQYGTSWPAFGAAAISTIAWILVWLYLPETTRRRPTAETKAKGVKLLILKEAMAQPRLRELLSLTFASVFAFVMLEVTFVFLCAHRFGLTEEGTGLLYAYFGVMMVFVQGWLLGRLVKRFGELRLVVAGTAVTAVGFLLISGVPLLADRTIAWIVLLVGCVPVTLGHGLTGPNLSGLVSLQAGGSKQGVTLGLAQGVASLARAIAPPVGGMMFDIGPHWPYWCGAAMLFGVSFLTLLVLPAQRSALRTVKRLSAEVSTSPS